MSVLYSCRKAGLLGENAYLNQRFSNTIADVFAIERNELSLFRASERPRIGQRGDLQTASPAGQSRVIIPGMPVPETTSAEAFER